MISVISVLGGPISWHRLSVIGAPQTDLAAATIGAQALGFEVLGGVGGLFSLEGVAIALLIMTINGCGWLLVTTIFTSKLDTLRVKLSGGDMTWLMLLSAAASIGLFGNFAAIRVTMGTDHMVGVMAAFATQFIIDKFLAPSLPAIKGYAISIALVIGIFCAAMIGPPVQAVQAVETPEEHIEQAYIEESAYAEEAYGETPEQTEQADS
jgi:hypothetical protein